MDDPGFDGMDEVGRWDEMRQLRWEMGISAGFCQDLHFGLDAMIGWRQLGKLN